jgi:hypothetical protein
MTNLTTSVAILAQAISAQAKKHKVQQTSVLESSDCYPPINLIDMPCSATACIFCNGIPPDYPKATEAIATSKLAGTYADTDMACCKTHVTPIGPCLGVCFCCGPVPFSGACACPAGQNCFTNYQGYWLTVVDEDTIVAGWLCCNGVLKKENKPSQNEMK